MALDEVGVTLATEKPAGYEISGSPGHLRILRHVTTARIACRRVIGWLLTAGATLSSWAVMTATTAYGDASECSAQEPTQIGAELFAADNTGVIADREDARLRDPVLPLEITVTADVVLGGARPSVSVLIDGVFWSQSRQRLTYERSRLFDLCIANEAQLHAIAELVRYQFDQESVLTFEHLPQGSREADAVEIRVPDVCLTQFGDALADNRAARERLEGGSVTQDHTLILVAARGDEALARWTASKAVLSSSAVSVTYGKREFVE
jgi:hypothetical protein